MSEPSYYDEEFDYEEYMMEREECHYGLDQCHDPKCRDLSSCLGCWVLDLPAWMDKNTQQHVKRIIEHYQIPYEMIKDTVYIDPKTFPMNYGAFAMELILQGFKISWPIPEGALNEET